MAEYYVVRDKNTGLYFRGKGVNRWGKYYNQASIYRIKANAENTIKEVSWRGEQAEIVPIQIVETTADVVPKSEVEKEIKNWQELYADTVSKWDKAYEELEAKYEDLQEQFRVLDAECDRMEKVESKQYDDIIQAKVEVAREIFEEIERYAELQIESLNIAEKVDSRGADFFGGGKQAFVLLLDRLAELKKKYTEGE